MIKYSTLLMWFRKGLRNLNWFRLSKLERALYWATLLYAKIKRKIVNSTLVSKIMEIIEKLRETPRILMLKLGFSRIEQSLEIYEENNVFSWCPKLKEWLSDPNYILWLGLNEMYNPNYVVVPNI